MGGLLPGFCHHAPARSVVFGAGALGMFELVVRPVWTEPAIASGVALLDMGLETALRDPTVSFVRIRVMRLTIGWGQSIAGQGLLLSALRARMIAVVRRIME